MRRVLLGALLALVLAPAARADTLVPVHAVSGKGVATCLRATGVPGGLAQWRPGGVALLSGTTELERVRLGQVAACPEAAAAPGGAAVVAAIPGRGRSVRAAVREPGGAFGAPVRLRRGGGTNLAAAVAVSQAGHAVVAWAQRRGAELKERYRVLVARRAPGGSFGPVEALTGWQEGNGFRTPEVVAATDAAGAATVAWFLPLPLSPRTGDRTAVEAASAAPGARFAVQRVATTEVLTRPALAVAADGWALLAHDGYGGVSTYERAPGATRFTRVLSARDTASGSPVVAVRDGGGGLVAWRSGIGATAGVGAAVRAGAGPFGAPREVAEDVTSVSDFGGAGAVIVTTGAPLELGNESLRGALAPDGRALLAWGGSRAAPGSAVTARSAAGTLAAGFGASQEVGGRILDVNGVAPVFLPDGRAALAWTDNAGRYFSSFPSGHGTLHLAVEGSGAIAAPAPPRLTLRARPVQRRFPFQSPVVTAGCDRPCELRVAPAGEEAAVTATLTAAGSMRLVVPSRRRRVRVRVQAAARGGSAVARASVLVRVVRWRTAEPARHAYYSVEGVSRRGGLFDAGDRGAWRVVEGKGRTSFTVRLRPRGRVRWVQVEPISVGGPQAPRPVTVRVR